MRCKQKMTAEYSAHPALASNILNTSLSLTSSHQNCNSIPASSHPAHYKHHKKFSTATSKTTTNTKTCNNKSISATTYCVDNSGGSGNNIIESSISVKKSNPNTNTIPCSEVIASNSETLSPALPDRTTATKEAGTDQQHPNHLSFNPHTLHQCSSNHPHQHSLCIGNTSNNTDCNSSSNTSASSNESTPSHSTISSPLSTPTRLATHCCQMTSTGAAAAAQVAAVAAAAAATTSSIAGCKKSTKFDPRLGPSPYRQLLPIALCILSFATVFSILIVYMDTTEIRHQQFRLNMSRDYELFGVAQDDPTLIAFLREIHMKKYPMHFLKKAPEEHLNFTQHHELTPEMAHYVADLVGGKLNGAVIQSLPGPMGNLMTAPWLAETLNWAGVIIEPEPRRYFTLRKQNSHRSKMQVVHACVSPNKHPKEVTIHNEEAEVRINSLLDEETSWFNSRVKCFPLYTIMMASNRIDFDLLSLGVHGRELEILQTLPFNKVNIEVISIHLPEDHENVRGYIQSVTKFLMGKSYRLQKTFGRNYFYQKLNTNRTRKKDIFTKKP